MGGKIGAVVGFAIMECTLRRFRTNEQRRALEHNEGFGVHTRIWLMKLLLMLSHNGFGEAGAHRR